MEASNSGSLSVSVMKTVLFDCDTEVGALISSTYIHSLLIAHLACWISPEFALKVSKIVNNFLIAEYQPLVARLTGIYVMTLKSRYYF